MVIVDVTRLYQESINQALLPVFISNLQCSGQETSLLDCGHDSNNNCEPSVVAGVKCTGLLLTISKRYNFIVAT